MLSLVYTKKEMQKINNVSFCIGPKEISVLWNTVTANATVTF